MTSHGLRLVGWGELRSRHPIRTLCLPLRLIAQRLQKISPTSDWLASSTVAGLAGDYISNNGHQMA